MDWNDWPVDPVIGPSGFPRPLANIVMIEGESDEERMNRMEEAARQRGCHPCNVSLSEQPDPAWEAFLGVRR